MLKSSGLHADPDMPNRSPVIRCSRKHSTGAPLHCQRDLRTSIRKPTALIIPGSVLMTVSLKAPGDMPCLTVFGFVALWGFAAVVLGVVPLPGRIAVLLGLATTRVRWQLRRGLGLAPLSPVVVAGINSNPLTFRAGRAPGSDRVRTLVPIRSSTRIGRGSEGSYRSPLADKLTGGAPTIGPAKEKRVSCRQRFRRGKCITPGHGLVTDTRL